MREEEVHNWGTFGKMGTEEHRLRWRKLGIHLINYNKKGLFQSQDALAAALQKQQLIIIMFKTRLEVRLEPTSMPKSRAIIISSSGLTTVSLDVG